jgi:hypothetical protein
MIGPSAAAIYRCVRARKVTMRARTNLAPHRPSWLTRAFRRRGVQTVGCESVPSPETRAGRVPRRQRFGKSWSAGSRRRKQKSPVSGAFRSSGGRIWTNICDRIPHHRDSPTLTRIRDRGFESSRPHSLTVSCTRRPPRSPSAVASTPHWRSHNPASSSPSRSPRRRHYQDGSPPSRSRRSIFSGRRRAMGCAPAGRPRRRGLGRVQSS